MSIRRGSAFLSQDQIFQPEASGSVGLERGRGPSTFFSPGLCGSHMGRHNTAVFPAFAPGLKSTDPEKIPQAAAQTNRLSR